MTHKKRTFPECNIKINEFGSPIFKSKGTRKKVKKDLFNFMKEKF